MRAQRSRFPLLFVVFVVLAGLACDDGTSPPLPTLETIWPAEEGRTWSFRASLHEWEPDAFDSTFAFTSPDQVPDFPDWDTLMEYFRNPPLPPVADTTSYGYGLRFEGSVTTPFGVTARNLVESVDGVDLVFCGSGDTLAAARPFLRALSRIEPRSRLAITRVLGRTEIVSAPNVLIHGGAFEKTDAWVGTYGCLDTLLAWKFLGADLKPGATFTLQLLPSVTDNVFLHARVYRQRGVTTPAGRFANALEILYAVDFGIQEYSNEVGGPLSYGRLTSLGSVLYANGVGPVANSERALIPVGTDGLGVGVGDVILSLESYGAPLP